MRRILNGKPEDTTIVMRDCVNRGGHHYRHAFVGEFAISRRLESLLSEEFGVRLYTGNRIPEAFFKKYDLIEVTPDYSNPNREEFVTSDCWYTCNPSYENVYEAFSWR